jgi:SsrA-binding protein
MKTPDDGYKVICENRKARFKYFIEESYEVGIVLTGAEIKSIRAGEVRIDESYARVMNRELFLLGAHIAPYAHMSQRVYDPTRTRKLLMKRSDIDKVMGLVDRKGFTLVPLKLYLANRYAKLQIGLCKGKAAPDKRADIKKRELDREAQRAVKR